LRIIDLQLRQGAGVMRELSVTRNHRWIAVPWIGRGLRGIEIPPVAESLRHRLLIGPCRPARLCDHLSECISSFPPLPIVPFRSSTASIIGPRGFLALVDRTRSGFSGVLGSLSAILGPSSSSGKPLATPNFEGESRTLSVAGCESRGRSPPPSSLGNSGLFRPHEAFAAIASGDQ